MKRAQRSASAAAEHDVDIGHRADALSVGARGRRASPPRQAPRRAPSAGPMRCRQCGRRCARRRRCAALPCCRNDRRLPRDWRRRLGDLRGCWRPRSRAARTRRAPPRSAARGSPRRGRAGRADRAARRRRADAFRQEPPVLGLTGGVSDLLALSRRSARRAPEPRLAVMAVSLAMRRAGSPLGVGTVFIRLIDKVNRSY